MKYRCLDAVGTEEASREPQEKARWTPHQTSHHRVVSYKLASLNTIVQYQADAYKYRYEQLWSDGSTSTRRVPAMAMVVAFPGRLQLLTGEIEIPYPARYTLKHVLYVEICHTEK